MDHLQLAQFNNISNSSNSQGYDFLNNNKININSIIPKDCYVGLERDPHAGYTYLHFAAKNFDLPSIKKLINCNADLTKQDFKFGQTPLHILSGFHNHCAYSSRDVFRYMGRLEEDEFVNILLSAQVRKCNAVNPMSSDGMSHLHIACIYNHTQAVQLFLNAGESVDHATNANHSELPGYTALHFAVRYSAVEAAELLLKHGANTHVKNFKDESSLHLLIKRLMGIADYLTIHTHKSYLAHYEEERDILESIINIFLENLNSEHATMPDDIGLTALHIACTLKYSSMAEKLLRQNIDCNVTINSNSKFWPGWTPLHFAACFSVETFKLLLRHGVDFTIKNAKKETALDMCMQRYTLDIVHSIISEREELCNIMFTDGSTKLIDIILAMNNNDKLAEFLKHSEDTDSINIKLDSPAWPGYNILHLAVLNEPIEYEYKFFDTLVSQSPIMLHWRQIMNHLLKANCNFNTENADGLTPIFLALKIDRVTSVDIILNPCEENYINKDGLSLFHVACATGDLNSVQWFVEEKEVDVDLPIKCSFEWKTKNCITARINSTPLHIAVIFKNMKVIKYLLDKDANVYAKDALGLTPIHLSMIHDYSISTNIFNLLLKRSCWKKACVTKDGLSHLHVASYCDNEIAIKELLQNGADANVRFQPTSNEMNSMFTECVGRTPLHIAMSKEKSEAVKALIEGGADIFAISGNSPRKLLHEAMQKNVWYDTVCTHFMLKLQQDYFDTIGPIDETNVTMLHFACLKQEVKWIKNLLVRGENVNARMTVQGNFLHYWSGSTPIDVLIFGLSCKDGDPAELIEIIKLLLKYGADVNVINGRGYSPLHLMYYEETNNDPEFPPIKAVVPSVIDLLIKSLKSFDVNPVDPYGLSHFHVACMRGNVKVVRKFLDAGVDVNHSTVPSRVDLYPDVRVERELAYSSLHYACHHNHTELARLLIEHGANVKVEDLRGDTPLHVFLREKWFDIELIELLLRCGADINAKNALGITPLQYFVMKGPFTIQDFDFMLNHGAAIDFTDVRYGNVGIIGIAIKNAVPDEREMVFEEIVDKCGVKNAIENGFNAIESVVAIKHEGQLTVDFYMRIIKIFINMGCNIDHQDAKGNTAFHGAVRFYNIEAVKALLLFGADFNILNKSGESPITKEVINVGITINRLESILYQINEQIYKMQHIGLNVIEYNLLAITKVGRKYRRDGQPIIKSTWTRELDKIKKIFIEKLALAYFLSNSAVMRYSSLPLLKRQAIDDFFQHDNLQYEFPYLVGCLMLQYRKAVARANMIKPAMEIIFSAGIELPALCLKQIVEHLGYDDMKILVAEST